ncbi:hypothetical protein EGW08_001430 [Elysia chlorotica]|uniref:Kinetochore protein Nuf2 N-terminal domain-containing protein n=1 Tax=Elysia chlorotica TaxID=188477 RepID=A0A3S1I276_ELYCH|nr:hypothetical protein EGW08_001430 [Elysia chlorotica]
MNYESPQLLVSEIITAFKEYDIDISENDFRAPDPRRWREIYAVMYEALTGIPIESTIQTLLKEVKMNSSNPEAFEEAADQIAFTQCLQRVLSGCGYKKFSLKDVLHPGPKTVRRISSVFVNRSRHDTRVIGFFEETADRAQKSLGEYESVLRRNKELNHRNNEGEANYGHRKAELKKLQDDVEDANRIYTELQTASEEEKRCGQELKLKISETESNKAALKLLLEQKNQECEKLSRKIVQSPKKFQVDLERLKNKVMDMKSQLSKEEQVLSESRLQLEQTMHKIDAATKAAKLAIEVQSDLDKDMEICVEISRLSEKQVDLQEAINSCHLQEEDLLERFNVRQAQRHTVASHTDLRQQSSLQKIVDYKQFADKLKEDLKTAQNETSLIKDKVTQVKSKVSEVEDRIAEEREDVLKEKNMLITEMVEKLDEISEQNLLKLKKCVGNR